MHKIHLDTDLGGDMDDLCALAMLLRWSEDVQLTGITTVADVSQGFYHYPELMSSGSIKLPRGEIV